MSARGDLIQLSRLRRSGGDKIKWGHQFVSHTPDVSLSLDFADGINAIAIVGVAVDQVQELITAIFPPDHEMRKYSSVKEFKGSASGFLSWVTGASAGNSGVLWSLPKDHFFPIIAITSSSKEEAPEAHRSIQFAQGLQNLCKGRTVFAKVIYLSVELRNDMIKGDDAKLKIKHLPYPDHVLARTRYFDPAEINIALSRRAGDDSFPTIAPFPISVFGNDLEKFKAFRIHDILVFSEAAPGIFEFFKAIDQHYIVM